MSKVPQPKSFPLFGTLFSLIKEGGGPKLHQYVNKRHRELGSLYKEKIGPVEAYFLNDPMDMRKVFASEGQYPKHILPECWIKYQNMFGCSRGLYFMDGKEWLTHRKVLNIHLLKTYDEQLQTQLTKNVFQMFMENVLKENNSSQKINFEPHLYQLSIYFVIATMLGSPFITQYQTLVNEIQDLSQVVHKIFEHSVALSLLPIDLSVTLNLSAWKNFVLCVDKSLAIASSLCDTLDQLEGDGLISKLRNENISSDCIRRIVIDFILAAGDTTAIATQWILYCLAIHPSEQDHVHSSLSSRHTESINNVIRETLRLYPIAPFITRFLPNDIQLKGFNIPANSLMLISLYSSSRNSKYFPSPEEFQPNRWSRINNKYIGVKEPFASIPFAMGARSCIGRKMAYTQMQLTISQLINQYEIHVEKKVDMVLKLITVPAEPIRFHLVPR